MCQRVRELKQTVSAQPTDVKKLQLRLQVSVLSLWFVLTFICINKQKLNFENCI